MIDYERFPGLDGFYLEDSFVLDITETPSPLIFSLDAVLTPEHPAYRPPRAGEHHCYRPADLTFSECTSVEWLHPSHRFFTDATEAKDLGNIDALAAGANSVFLEGDWGRVRVWGSPTNGYPRPRMKLQLDHDSTVGDRARGDSAMPDDTGLPGINSYIDLIDRFLRGSRQRARLSTHLSPDGQENEQRILGEPVFPVLHELFEDADRYVAEPRLRTGTEDLDDEGLMSSAGRAREALRHLGYT